MKHHDIIATANSVAFQHLLVCCFSEDVCYGTYEIGGAVIIVERSRHRTGVPADASPLRYVVTHAGQGWSMVARTVWLHGRLLPPLATHTSIDLYYDDDGRHEDHHDVVASAVNSWFCSLDL